MADGRYGDAVELGYFFSTIGTLKFSEGDPVAPGDTKAVTVADKYGVTVYSDLRGQLCVGSKVVCTVVLLAWHATCSYFFVGQSGMFAAMPSLSACNRNATQTNSCTLALLKECMLHTRMISSLMQAKRSEGKL